MKFETIKYLVFAVTLSFLLHWNYVSGFVAEKDILTIAEFIAIAIGVDFGRFKVNQVFKKKDEQ